MTDKNALIRALAALSYACGYISQIDPKQIKVPIEKRVSHKYLEAEVKILRRHLRLPKHAKTLPVKA